MFYSVELKEDKSIIFFNTFNYLRGKEKWLSIFNQELLNRN